jgi:hypothetical protein
MVKDAEQDWRASIADLHRAIAFTSRRNAIQPCASHTVNTRRKTRTDSPGEFDLTPPDLDPFSPSGP